MSTNTPVINKWTKFFPAIVIILAIAVVVSYLIAAPLPAFNVSAPILKNDSGAQSGLEADAARYTSMAAYYAVQADNFQRSLEADAARYIAMAEFYNTEAAGIQRGLEADAARYTAMAKYFTEAKTARLQRSLDADAARYTGMAEYYMTK